MPPLETWGSDNGGNSYGSTSIRKSSELTIPRKDRGHQDVMEAACTKQNTPHDHTIHSDRGGLIVDQGSLKNESYSFQHKAL